ncbi:SDR family NAD(P)-dependent oxidoreductase [Inquilinus sp. CAU 1745]|uniref:SDR family NAD(P)-dependent oxidoreductase n=1 Tax=Inquilinus sp. CAU 1745 TaxID=3140369 RepID=UPI00325C04D4
MTKFREDLKDSVIVVLGASSGFGRGAALKLGRAGAKVVLAARRDNLLSEIENDIRAAGGEAVAAHCDISDAKEVNAVARTAVERYGRIDVWINNVGVGALGLFWDIPVEDQARVIDVNFKGLMFGAHAALLQFRKQGHGVLVNTGSIDSEVPLAYQTTYAATKAAVLSMSRSLNEELRLGGENDSIKVATIMPWAVDTPWWSHAANYTGHQPRMAAMDDPEIVVDAIVKACTDPKEEMPVGAKAHSSNISHHVFPDLTERMSATIADREVKKAGSLPPTTGSIYEPMQEGSGVGGGIRRRMKEEDQARRH